MVNLAILVGGVALVLVMFLILRWGKLPPWTHRDVLAFSALLATVGGAIILSLMVWGQTGKFNEQADRLISELVRERPTNIAPEVGNALSTIIDSLTWSLKLDNAGIIVVLLSLGLVISARTLKAKVLGGEFEMNGGEARAAAAAAQDTADSAQNRADQIADQATVAEVDAAPTAK